MTVSPVNESDYYGKGFEQMSHASKMLGPPRMNFGAPRVDDDRIVSAVAKNSYLDSQPTDPEWMVWQMRPREKKKEIGPSMRFNSHFQAERLMDNLKNRTQTFFTRNQVAGDPQNNDLEKKIRDYNKTGKFAPVSKNHEDSMIALANTTMPTSPKIATTSNSPHVKEYRKSSLQRSNYFLEPRDMMNTLHTKTHFKAAISVSKGDPCCLKVGSNEFGDQFAEIARNIDAMNRQAESLSNVNQTRGSFVSSWLNKNRNCHSQGRQRRIGQTTKLTGPDMVSDRLLTGSERDFNDGPLKTEGMSDPSQRDSVLQSQDITKTNEWKNLTEEEKAILQRHSRQKINPGQVTNQVLKLCGVVRQKLDVHGPSEFTRKRSGLGGTGGRQLSPELRIRFGTYGFKNKRDDEQILSNQNLLDEAQAESIDFSGSTKAGGTHVRTKDRSNFRESMDTADSMQAPPALTQSVDLGMTSEDTAVFMASRSGSLGSNTYQRRKKQVVLRRAFQRGGHSVNSKLVKSLTSMPAKYSQVVVGDIQ